MRRRPVRFIYITNIKNKAIKPEKETSVIRRAYEVLKNKGEVELDECLKEKIKLNETLKNISSKYIFKFI